MEDKERIIHAFRNGSEGAFEELFKHFYPALLFFGRQLVSQPGVAEEVVQDVLFRLWQKKKDFASYDNIKGFVYISVKNGCLDALTRENRKLNRENTYAGRQPVLADGFDEALIHAEFLLQIRSAINRLPKQCRKIILMMYDEGKSPKQIAAELQLSVSTVNNQKARGIDLMRKQLSKSHLRILLLMLP